MKNSIDINAISDGKHYHMGDTVKADAMGCKNCTACCHDVGNLVSLSPKDVHRLKEALGATTAQLFESFITVKIEDKLHLPYLKMAPSTGSCIFLNQEGFCSIHTNRPDICRLFPMARVYEEDDYYYILQKNACVKPKLDYVTLEKWIDISDYPVHKDFVIRWHKLLKALRFRLKFIRDENTVSDMGKVFLESFYDFDKTPITDYYDHFNKTLKQNKDKLGIL